MMSRGRKKASEVDLYRSTRFERAQHINEMQSRTFNNQLEVMEQNIRKKLKVIESEKHQMSNYIKFLRSSSGTSRYSLDPEGKIDTPRMRPSTARVQRLKFGCDGNSNHTYMSSDPRYGWPSSYYVKEDEYNNRRAKSAYISRARMTSHRTIMSRVQEIEAPLRKRVSWIDGGIGGEAAIKGNSSAYRTYSANGRLTKPLTANSGTQYDAHNGVESDDVTRDEIDSVISSMSSGRKSQVKDKRQHVAIQPINVTFPFPVTPDKYRSDNPVKRGEMGNQFLSHDRRRSVTASLTSQSPRRRSRQLHNSSI